jgi:hypothetical protein
MGDAVAELLDEADALVAGDDGSAGFTGHSPRAA